MNNEPVAWMHKPSGTVFNEIIACVEPDDLIPLYTHPAKTEDEGKVCARCGAIAYDPVITQTAKTLTDEEIWSLMDEIETLVHGDIKRAMYRMARKVEGILNE